MIGGHEEKTNLIDLICSAAKTSMCGITFIRGENNESFLPYSGLLAAALSILKGLQEYGIKAGDEAVFQIEDNEDFFKTFWACVLGGIIPVPVTIGNNEEHRVKLLNIWKYLNNPYLIADTRAAAAFDNMVKETANGALIEAIKARTLSVEGLAARGGEGKVCHSRPEDIAFLQFSSGSTGDPKGVILTHKNLLANTGAIIESAGLSRNDSSLGWMPLTHDMGMIGGHLTPVRMGIMQYSILYFKYLKERKRITKRCLTILSYASVNLIR